MANGHGRTGRDEDQVRSERARAVALFRYSLIREAADQRLSTKQRGRLGARTGGTRACRPVR